MSCMKQSKIGLLACLALAVLALCSLVLLRPQAADTELENTYFSVTAESNDSTMGRVTVSGDYESPDVPGTFRYNTDVILTAIPEEGYRLLYWEGPTGVGTTEELEILVKGDAEYTAVFGPLQYDIIIADDPRLQFPDQDSIPKVHTYGTATSLPVLTVKDEDAYVFRGWKVTHGENTTDYNSGASLGAFDFTKTDENGDPLPIYLEPICDPRPYDVLCIDQAGEGGTQLGSTTISSYYGAENVSGLDIGTAVYRGYFFLKEHCGYTTLAKVQANSAVNVVYRYYQAKTYRILYNYGEGVSVTHDRAPAQHVYGTETVISTPIRTGYRFVGWQIGNADADPANTLPSEYLYDNNSFIIEADAYDNPNWTYENKDSEEVAIILTAMWEPLSYDVQYEGVEGIDPGIVLPDERVYNQAFALPNLTKPGYTFLGWTLAGYNEEPTMDFELPANWSAENDLVFVAHWSPNSYTVTLDPGAADAQPGDATVDVIFDAPLPTLSALPTRQGYTFLGYFGADGKQYYNADGTCCEGVVWDQAADAPVLTARWQQNEYTVDVELTLPGDCTATITVNGLPLTDSPLPFGYGSELTVIVELSGGCKLVSWNGAGISHTARFEYTFTLTDDTVLSGIALPALASPALTVDYPNEQLTAPGGIPAGTYRLVCGDVTLTFTVGEDGTVRVVTGESTTPVGSLSVTDYLGKTVYLTVCGDGQTTADSDPQVLEILGRPAAPVYNEDITGFDVGENSIGINMSAGSTGYEYEFAISKDVLTDFSGLTWQDASVFENLEPGTVYYVYIRVKSSAAYPHGEVYRSEPKETISHGYLEEMKNRVENSREPGDGDNVKELIEATTDRMDKLEHSSDYVEQMEAILADFQAKLPLARVKDHAIAALRERCEELRNSGAYSEEVGIPALEDYLAQGIAAINGAQSEGEVERISEDTELNFRSVLISYLFYGEDILLSTPGIAWDFRLMASRVTDLGAISAQIQQAVQAGTIVVGGTEMTLAEASEALRSLDVLGYYRMQLARPSGGSTAVNGPFTVRLLIPEDLRGESGLLVVYYNTATQELTVLDTHREGNYLYFTADSVADFVILGDHAVNLTGAVLALGGTLLCQLVALAILLVRRHKFAKEYRSYAMLLPAAALTLRFFPDYAVSLTLVLGALVIVMQIILLALFLSTDVIYRKKKDPHGDDPSAAPAGPAGTPPAAGGAAAGGTAADAAVIATLLANHAGEEEHYEDLDAEEPPLTYPDADEPDAAAHTAPTSEAFPAQADPFAAESEEDWYGDDSFIEPAANPSYSLENDPGADPWDSPDDADAGSRYFPDGETDIDSRYSSEEERSADPYAFPEDGADADPYAFPEDEPPADPYSSPEDAPSENAENGADAWDYDDTSYEEDDTVRYDGESN